MFKIKNCKIDTHQKFPYIRIGQGWASFWVNFLTFLKFELINLKKIFQKLYYLSLSTLNFLKTTPSLVIFGTGNKDLGRGQVLSLFIFRLLVSKIFSRNSLANSYILFWSNSKLTNFQSFVTSLFYLLIILKTILQAYNLIINNNTRYLRILTWCPE